MRPTTALLTIAATMRLTRLIITDEIGDRYIQSPADRFVAKHSRPLAITPPSRSGGGKHQQQGPDLQWWRDGLLCPWCIGFWVGLAVTGTAPWWSTRRVPRAVVAALALNEVVAHVGGRLGDYGDPEPDPEPEPVPAAAGPGGA